MNSQPIENVVIIGGGPAGLSAAIYASRAGLTPLVIAGSPSGGQLMLTTEVENYPGYESILGTDLIEKMRNHAKKFGTRIVEENVVKVDFSKRPFEICATRCFSAHSVIIATGAKALWLGLDSEKRLRGKGVSACATCDGFFFKNKVVAVIGGGDTALEEALTLTKFASKVYIIHRRGEFRASKIMQERVLNHQKIEVIWNSEVEEVIGTNKVESIKLKSVAISPTEVGQLQSEKTNFNRFQPILTDRLLKVDGVFIAIGHKPDTELFTGKVELDSKGYIITYERAAIESFKSQITNHKSQTTNKSQIQNFKQFNNLELGNYRSATSVEGVFAAGDCVDHVYKQAGTAAGMGIAAALDVEKYLELKI